MVRVKDITRYWENKMQEMEREKESIPHNSEKGKNWCSWWGKSRDKVWHVGDKFQDQLEYYEGEAEKMFKYRRGI